MNVIVLACPFVGIGFFIRHGLPTMMDEDLNNIVQALRCSGDEFCVRATHLIGHHIHQQSSQWRFWQGRVIDIVNCRVWNSDAARCEITTNLINDQILERLASKYVCEDVKTAIGVK